MTLHALAAWAAPDLEALDSLVVPLRITPSAPRIRWSCLDAGLEVLEVNDAPARAWSFVWPARVLVQALSEGVRYCVRREQHVLAIGAVIAIDAPAAHVTVHTDRGASFRVIFEEPPSGPADQRPPVRVKEPRLVADLGTSLEPATLHRRVALELPKDLPWVGRIDARIARACTYIDDNLAETSSLETLASRVAIHRCHFCRIFAQQVGLAPLRYRAQMRVARARQLLAAGLDCVAVAFEVGYCDQSHFNRCFQKSTGITPGAYARAVRRSPWAVAA
jgi:AraC-like DNA-binding protein